MNDWKKIEPPMLVLSLYSERTDKIITILSTNKMNLFNVVNEDPQETGPDNAFVGTLTEIAEEFNIPPRILVEGYRSARPGIHPSAQDLIDHTRIVPDIQDSRHHLSAQELVEKGYIAQPAPHHKGVGTSINWELNTATPKHDGDVNKHGKDLSKFLSGWWKDQIPSWAQWLCIDGSGQVYWFEEKPAFSNYGWVRTAGEMEHGPKCNIDGYKFEELIWERKTKSNV